GSVSLASRRLARRNRSHLAVIGCSGAIESPVRWQRVVEGRFMRIGIILALVALLCCGLGAVTLAESVEPRPCPAPEKPPTASPAPESPGLASLKKQLARGNAAALDEFWKEVGKQGAPLVEPAPTDDKHQLVTFVWRARDQARVVVMSEFGHSVRS